MKPQIWANFSVKDINRTAEFYKALGFESNMGKPSDELTSFKFGKNDFVIHFFVKESLEKAMGKVADVTNGNEIIFSLSADSKEEIDEWVKKVKDAGGTIFKEAGRDEKGYYYCGFADPDGHKFNVLLMEEGM